MKNNEQGKEPTLTGIKEQSAIFPITRWIFKYKWHVLFWIGYFFYAYLTDKLTYGKYIYLSKEIILVGTHPFYLFYSFLFCFNSFEKQTPLKLFRSILFFIAAIALFWVMRVGTNYYLYPIMDVARGLGKERLVTKDFVINGVFWVTEFLIKAAFFFYVVKYIRKEREFRVVLSEKLDNERALTEKRIEQEVSMQRQKEYEQRETMFINLVHETKTPITLINNYINDHIDHHGSSPELEIVRSNVKKLSRDVTNLFDLERFRHGVEMFNHNQRVDFSILVNNTCHHFAAYAQKKSIRLSKEIDENVLITADPVALDRIVNNLIENAIKYSPNDTEILVTLTAVRGIVQFSVADQGDGITADEMEHIFTPYHLLNKKKQNIQGMGLGLPMVKNIVDTLDGEISLRNGDSGGTLASVLLPVGEKMPLTEMPAFESGAAVIEERDQIETSYHNEDTPHILVVEDNHDLNSYVVRKLSRKYNVHSAANGKEALDLLKMQVPDLIISDVMMDNIDGFEFASILQRTPGFAHLPIIFLTAKTTDIDKMRGLSLGAIDYIQKPFFTTDELIKKIDSILNYAQKRELKLYSDMYKTMKMLSRNNSWPEEVAVGESTFEQRCDSFKLTNRETEVAKLLVAGKSAREIAEATFISERTVNAHTRNIYEKTGVTNKTELINLLRK